MLYVANIALGLALIALIIVLLASFYFLDRLIRYGYAFHRSSWERDGRPNGFLFRPPEITWFGSGMAFQRCALSWPLHTPPWIRTEATAKALHTRLRWCVLTWNVGLILWIVLFLWYLSATNASNQSVERTAARLVLHT